MAISRLPALDLLRGLAAIAVVFFHYTFVDDTVRPLAPGIAAWSNYGYLGVHLFFMISGFVIFMTLERTTGALEFLLARASRLYPAFLLSIVLTIAITYQFPDHRVFSTREIVYNATMVPNFFHVELVNHAYWTLAKELTFYGLVFLCIVLLGKARAPWLIACWFALSAINIAFKSATLDRILILEWAPLFSAGAALFLSTQALGPLRAVYLLFFGITLPVALYYAVGNAVDQSEHFPFWTASTVVVLSIIAMFYVLMTTIAYRPGLMAGVPRGVVELCGGGSYTLYLIHERIGHEALKVLIPRFGLVSIAALVLAMIATAGVMFFCFDKPVQRALRALRVRAITRQQL